MTEEDLKKAIIIDKELKELKEVKSLLEEHKEHWWKLVFPRDDEVRIPSEKLRIGIRKVVEELIIESKKELEAL